MGFSKAEMDAKLNDIIEFAEIGDYIGQVVKTYSSGMFARLAFSCAINVEPEILIVDEILSVGDMRFQAKCFQKFKEFKEKGVTILYVGHDVGMMRSFCDRCIWINNGKLVADGDPTYITAQFTEFMYLDDQSEFTLYKKFQKEALNVQENKENTYEKKEEKMDEPEVSVKAKISEKSKFQGCLAHWGTNVGMITKVEMCGDEEKEKNYFTPYEKMKIKVYFDDDLDIERENLSVAISIKNKEGTDLCVKTTFDEKIEIPKEKKHCVIFEFQSMLSNGEYYLVVAMENRENINPTYFEYIEGIKYFKIFSDKKIFGVFDVNSKITVE